jgi:putative ABC transport system permease protein
MNLLTELKEGLGISLSSLRANKLRSTLTTLGIIIGILTVTLMGSAIEALDRAFLKSVSVIGADVLYVQRFDWFAHSRDAWMKMQKRKPITLQQVEALSRQLTLAKAVAPLADTSQRIQYGRRHSDNVTILGTTEQFLQVGSLSLAEGRFLSAPEVQSGRSSCVIGFQVATNLFSPGAALGSKVTIGGQSFEVVGVLDKLGSFLDGSSMDNEAIIPLRQFVSAFQHDPDYQIQVKAMEPSGLEDTREEMRMAMRKVRHLAPGEPEDFAINQQDQFVELFHRIAGTIAGIGLFITGLSLFVGGIGIMNIMYVSVAERTREIGIRKAIGAKKRTILLQFLTESAAICLFGGLLALCLAWPLVLIMQRFMPATLSVPVISLALLVSLITGVVAGLLPAARAARMNVVDALRNE